MSKDKAFIEMREELLEELEVEILEQLKGCMKYSQTKSALDWSNIYKTIVEARSLKRQK